ncbi:MAG: ATP-dependent sacrificial sulfur transferase LarE [Deltaproteobacteria bacterium]|nr:ATP-dependent sacrificial sulfur transferase LarE [Deltaproteobacteria bacterium]
MDGALERLRGILRQMGSVLVAFSGGADSAFLLKVAHDVLGERAVALTALSPSLAPAEKDDAIAIAKQIGAEHLLVESQELEDPGYVANPSNRCYYCKTELFRVAEPERLRLDLAFVAIGTNLDDLGDHRPGLDAAREAGIRSPLVEAGMSKADVRRLSLELGLSTWDKPAAACLASRIPYGTAVTPERLRQVGQLEAELRSLGFHEVRARHHGEVARIEVAPAALGRALESRATIVAAAKRAGFAFVALDLEGYRTGSLNELLPLRTLRKPPADPASR